jgi:hypothetical protein
MPGGTWLCSGQSLLLYILNSEAHVKVILWIVGIIFLIGLLVVSGVLKLVF